MWAVRLRPALLVSVLVTLSACEAVKERLGLEDETPSGTTEAVAETEIEADTEDAEDEAPEPKHKKKRKRRKPKPKPPPPPPPETELNAALARAIVPSKDDPSSYRIDPFVLTLVADTLAREKDLPFTRITPKERKAGAPASFRVGKLPTPSLWRSLGLRPNDLVMAVEDAQPPGPKGLTQLRQRIPREGTLTVKLQRNGVAKELRYTIEPGLAWTRYLETEGGRTFEAPKSKPSGGSSSSKSSSSSSKSSSKPAAVPVKCSGSTCTVPKWYFDSLVGSSSKARQQMRGKSVGSGFKLTFVGPASRKAGFAVGDVITKINGRRTNNQLDMLALYGGLKSTKKFRVEFTRGSSKRTRTIIVEG